VSLLCLLLVVVHPVSVEFSASRALSSLALRGMPTALVLLLRLIVAAVGVAAGRALFGRRDGALKLARFALIAAAATDVFVYLTPYFPANRAPGEAPVLAALSLAYYSFWLIYLSRSRRVREAFLH
jgi:hypothetical protein